jgi:hypothetical protein
MRFVPVLPALRLPGEIGAGEIFAHSGNRSGRRRLKVPIAYWMIVVLVVREVISLQPPN